MQPTATVLVYSDDANTREQVRLAAGRRPAADVPPVEFVECATLPAVLTALDNGGIDVCVLDGETAPAGGMGVCRQIKDEIFHCPPVLLLIGRPQDAWLATWSRADAAVTLPVEPVEFADALAALLRSSSACSPESCRGPVRGCAADRAASRPSEGRCTPPAGQTSGRSRAAWTVSVGAAVALSALPCCHFAQDRFQSP